MAPNSSEMLAQKADREPPMFVFLGETPSSQEQTDWQTEARVHGEDPKFMPGVAIYGYMAKKLERGPQGRGGDAMLADKKTGLKGVFDGLGGHNAEDKEADGRASAAAAEAMPATYERAKADLVAKMKAGQAGPEVAAFLDSQVAYSHPDRKAEDRQRKLDEIRAHPQAVQVEVMALYKSALELNRTVAETGGATTMTVGKTVVTPDGRAFEVIVNIGDSGAAIFRKDGTAMDVTKEDSAVDFLVSAGRLTPEEAKDPEHLIDMGGGKKVPVRKMRTAMLQAVGQEADRPLHPTVTVVELKPGDRIQYATDGIRDVIATDGAHDPKKSVETMRTAKSFDGALENLIDASEAAMKPDGTPVKDDDKALIMMTYDPKVRA